MFFFFLGPTYRLEPAQFKAHCREMIEEICKRDRPVIIVEDDEPVVEMMRYLEIPHPVYGTFADIKILGNIEGPMPVEWYTDPDVQTEKDWEINGPMPVSWFTDPADDELRESGQPEPVDVSALHRHKVLTVDTEEFASQLEEIIAAVSDSKDGRVIIFDDEKPLVQMIKPRKVPGPVGKVWSDMLLEEPFGTN